MPARARSAMARRAEPVAAVERYTARLHRAGQLRARHAFAAQWLGLYERLLEVQQLSCAAALAARPALRADCDLADYVAARVAPAVVAVTVRHGPPPLADAVCSADARAAVARWLAGELLPPVENFVARAAAAPVLEALAESGFTVDGPDPADDRHCPRCGGLPQVAFTARTDDTLVTAPRRLLCSRCASTWPCARLQCPACGETAGARLRAHTDTAQFAHLRADSCETCRTYLIAVDLRADAAAVPEVDELVATPLDLCMHERGYGKLVPNLMGIGW